MQPGLSTHVFLPQRLNAGLLDAMRRAGATTIEVFAARHHFDYTDRAAIRDIASWFRDTGTEARLHGPLSAETQWSRHLSPSLNLIDSEKSRRIDAMDEIKRCLESAEQIPFRTCNLHLGLKDDKWSPYSLEHALTAIEHLKAFAQPLGVQLLLENLQNEITTPGRLLEILQVGHFDSVGITLDTDHAHLTDWQNPGAGIDAAFDLLRPRIAELHLHDNGGQRDEHCWPGEPTFGIDWKNVTRHIASLPSDVPGILEIAHEPKEFPEAVTKKAIDFFSEQSYRSDDHRKP